jgi:predicted DNA-binding transcriptional regulator AlpA
MTTIEPGTTGRGPRAVAKGSPSGQAARGPPETRSSRKLLPTRVVMDRYSVSDRTIDRWVADPKLNFPQPIRINRKRFFYEHELEEFDGTRR